MLLGCRIEMLKGVMAKKVQKCCLLLAEKFQDPLLSFNCVCKCLYYPVCLFSLSGRTKVITTVVSSVMARGKARCSNPSASVCNAAQCDFCFLSLVL